jgi:hypothetical protein
MKEFNMTPEQWSKTPRLDKKIMHYFRMMESYYQDIAQAKVKANT